MFWKYLVLFLRYMLSSPIEWESILEKPRFLFFGFSAILAQVSVKLMRTKLDAKNFEWFDSQTINYFEKGTSFLGILLSLYCCFIFIFIWTKKFNLPFILLIKKKLLNGLQSPYYNDKFDLDKILEKLPELVCKPETFKNFLLGNSIQEEDKIICSYSKAKLLRFIIIIFGLKNEEKSYRSEIKTVINHYFINKTKKGNIPYKFRDAAGEITVAFSEKLNNSNFYSDELYKIHSIFLQDE